MKFILILLFINSCPNISITNPGTWAQWCHFKILDHEPDQPWWPWWPWLPGPPRPPWLPWKPDHLDDTHSLIPWKMLKWKKGYWDSCVEMQRHSFFWCEANLCLYLCRGFHFLPCTDFGCRIQGPLPILCRSSLYKFYKKFQNEEDDWGKLWQYLNIQEEKRSKEIAKKLIVW